MKKAAVIRDRHTTSSNQVGVVFLYVTMTNDWDIDYTEIKINEGSQFHQPAYEPSPYSLKNIIHEGGTDVTSVPSRTIESDEDLIVNFAQKLYASSEDIDPEISKAATKIFWDIL